MMIVGGVKIFAFSDTHGLHRKMLVPCDADVVICAGDAVEDNLSPEDYRDFLDWFEAVPAGLRIFVPGNHELIFMIAPKYGELLFKDRDIFLGLNAVVYHRGLSFYCFAFPEMLPSVIRDAGMADVLVSHYPPDMIPESVALEPRFHVFGHDHSLKDFPDSPSGTKYFNVSVYNELNEKF